MAHALEGVESGNAGHQILSSIVSDITAAFDLLASCGHSYFSFTDFPGQNIYDPTYMTHIPGGSRWLESPSLAPSNGEQVGKTGVMLVPPLPSQIPYLIPLQKARIRPS